MARDQVSVTCAAGAWTQLTNADVSNITFQVLEGDCHIRYTTDATTPTEAGGRVYLRWAGEQNTAISSLTALVGADRVWAKPLDGARGVVYVDHA